MISLRSLRKVLFFSYLVFGFSLNAQELESPNIRIMLTVSNDEENPGPLNRVISESIELEFIIQDFDVLSVDFEKRDKLFIKSKRSRTSYLVETHYKAFEGKVNLKFQCFRIADSIEIYSESFEYPVDLKLDDSIQKQSSILVGIIHKDIEENPQKVSYLVYDQEPVEREETLLLSGGFSLFIPMAVAGEYFSFGYMPFFQLHRTLDLPFGYLGIGVFLSLNIIAAEGDQSSTENLFISAGPDVRLGITLNKTFTLYVKVNTGVSFAMVNRNGEGYQGFMIPVLSSGLGSEISINDRLGIFIGTDYIMYFEESINVTGFSPSIGVCFSL